MSAIRWTISNEATKRTIASDTFDYKDWPLPVTSQGLTDYLHWLTRQDINRVVEGLLVEGDQVSTLDVMTGESHRRTVAELQRNRQPTKISYEVLDSDGKVFSSGSKSYNIDPQLLTSVVYALRDIPDEHLYGAMMDAREAQQKFAEDIAIGHEMSRG